MKFKQALNEQIKMPEDKPTIGVLLCKTTSETVVKYSLQGVETPMGIAEYTLATALPKELKGEIPTIEELEEELEKESERLEKPVDKKMSRLKELLKGLNHEAIKEKKSDEKTIEIFHLVLLRLYHEISDELRKEIIPFFDHFQSTIRIGNHSNKTIDGALEYLLKYPNEFDIGLEFSFLGFKRAGINTFNCNAQIRVYLHQFKYSISKSRNANGDLFEKLYHELPSDEEFSSIVNVLKEEILDDITRQIERIKPNKHFNDTL
ncbi:MAG: PDDEXK nuclease domain-containing protein [Bacteroidia bacterium]